VSSTGKSYNYQVKSALVQKDLKRNCCRRSELSAFMHFRGSVIISHHKPSLSITVEGASLARYLFRLLKKVSGVTPHILLRKENRLGHSYFMVRLSDVYRLKKLLNALKIKQGSGWRITPPAPSPPVLARCCRRSYLRGAFLAAGSLNSPHSSYHLEIFSEYEVYSRTVKSLMDNFKLEGSLRQRKNGYYTYLKKADSIMEFLRIIGAHPALLQMENQRVLKSMRNQVNRMVNCETANLDKSLQAAQHQLAIIQKIDTLMGLENLAAPIREAAELRRYHPEASLKELGEMLEPPVGKSGMNHRFRKMSRLCKQLEEGAYRGDTCKTN